MADLVPIPPISRRDDGVHAVQRVDRLRLLSPTEREEARRRREEARRKAGKDAPKRPAPKIAQDRDGGVDYSA
jgi:hypothetical protein